MYYDNEYTEQDAQRDMDAREEANEPYIADFVWTPAGREASERYLAIGGVFADDAGPIGAESDLDQATRRAPISAVPDDLCYHKWAFRQKEVA